MGGAGGGNAVGRRKRHSARQPRVRRQPCHFVIASGKITGASRLSELENLAGHLCVLRRRLDAHEAAARGQAQRSPEGAVAEERAHLERELGRGKAGRRIYAASA